jgi:hypothetical protein
MLYKKNKYCKRITNGPFFGLTYNDTIYNFPNKNFIFPNNITTFSQIIFAGCKTIDEYKVPRSISSMINCFQENYSIKDLSKMTIKTVKQFSATFTKCKNLIVGPKIELSYTGTYNLFGLFDQCNSLTRS